MIDNNEYSIINSYNATVLFWGAVIILALSYMFDKIIKRNAEERKRENYKNIQNRYKRRSK